MTISENGKQLYCSCFPDTLEISGGGKQEEGVRVNNRLELQILLQEPAEDEMLIITLPWGEEEQDFTNEEWGQAMHVSAFEGWSINEAENGEWGKHWVLVTKGQEVTRAHILFENVNVLCSGITCMDIYHKWNNGAEQKQYRIPLLKKVQKLRIEEFKAENTTVKKGEGIKLSWVVTGTENCILDPGNIAVLPIGEKTVYADEANDFTLRISRGGQYVSRQLNIYHEK